MQKYIFFLGRTPLLSLAELSKYFDCNEIIFFCDKYIVIESNQALISIKQIMDRLGGTLKIAKYIDETDDPKSILNKVTSVLCNYFPDKDGKKRFGVNTYKTKINIKKLIPGIKKNLKQRGYSVRFVNKNFDNLSTDKIINERLLSDKGCDLNIININNKTVVCDTIAVQDIESYTKRDFSRPGRDPRRGMLPPKLAQILINLSEGNRIWDPFCGTGVILMEALLIGKSVIGSDIDNKAIQDTERNILWLYEHFGYDKEALIFQHDATLSVKRAIDYDAIVAEPLLGPPLSGIPQEDELKSIIVRLEKLYLQFFKNNKPKKGTKIVFLLPCFKNNKKIVFMKKILDKIYQLGYNPCWLIKEEILNKFDIRLNSRNSLIYSRPNQVVAREIICLSI